MPACEEKEKGMQWMGEFSLFNERNEMEWMARRFPFVAP
jgi:hypothetical protein